MSSLLFWYFTRIKLRAFGYFKMNSLSCLFMNFSNIWIMSVWLLLKDLRCFSIPSQIIEDKNKLCFMSITNFNSKFGLKLAIVFKNILLKFSMVSILCSAKRLCSAIRKIDLFFLLTIEMHSFSFFLRKF